MNITNEYIIRLHIDMEQSKEYHINNSTIKIGFGNILDSQAEVIVNSSGSKLAMDGGLTRAIREYARTIGIGRSRSDRPNGHP